MYKIFPGNFILMFLLLLESNLLKLGRGAKALKSVFLIYIQYKQTFPKGHAVGANICKKY